MSAERITSRQNPLLRHIHKLETSRDYRWNCREYAGDGTKLLEEAIRWNADVKTVVLSDGLELPFALESAIRLVRVPSDVMQSISLMRAPQGALFVCGMPEELPKRLCGGCMILDGLQDPGNLGTILRTADALDVPLVLTEGCADLYNPKTVRAAMGAVFRVRPILAARSEVPALCRQQGIPLVATALSDEAVDLRTVDLRGAAVVVGSEGQGISRELLGQSDRQVIIPMNPHCESLNAAVAASIIMWQMKR